MEQNVGQTPPNMNVNIPELDLNDPMNELKKTSHMIVSPTSQAVSPTSQGAAPRKSSSGRWNCLCSPTTHAGSFRCRHHRSSGMHRGRSVGSNLSELGSKGGSISDSLPKLSSLHCK